MDYATALAKELQEAQAFELWRSQRRNVAFTSLELRSIALLRGELLNLAPAMAVTTSIANRLSTLRKTAAGPFNLKDLEPDLVLDGTSALRTIEPVETCFEVIQHWRNVESRLAFASNLTRHAQRNSGAIGSDRLVEVMADGWQRACNALTECVRQLAGLMSAAGLEGGRGDESELLKLLVYCGQGLWPCLDDDGHLQVPGWAERRIEPRAPLDVEVTIRVAGKIAPAKLLNLSSRGAAIATKTAVHNGQTIGLSVMEIEHAATVVWSKDGRVGLRLQVRLSTERLQDYRARCNL